MTMGALHAGHAALLRAARRSADQVLATIFVNPLQFAAGEDLDRYPRTLEADLALLRAEGADLVFAPTATEMYPYGEPRTRVEPGPRGEILEGAFRPGHFAGVLTVVLKLLNLTRADEAYFGEKDFQQLTLVRQMVAELDVPARIVGVPTVREADGLALSSRNRYLSPEERVAARSLSTALRAGEAAAAAGEDADGIIAHARKELRNAAGVHPDYLELTGVDLGPPPTRGEARLLVAARVGSTRLIDNLQVSVEPR
jgi:pantoate--beta-alanine ligase